LRPRLPPPLLPPELRPPPLLLPLLPEEEGLLERLLPLSNVRGLLPLSLRLGRLSCVLAGVSLLRERSSVLDGRS